MQKLARYSQEDVAIPSWAPKDFSEKSQVHQCFLRFVSERITALFLIIFHTQIFQCLP